MINPLASENLANTLQRVLARTWGRQDTRVDRIEGSDGEKWRVSFGFSSDLDVAVDVAGGIGSAVLNAFFFDLRARVDFEKRALSSVHQVELKLDVVRVESDFALATMSLDNKGCVAARFIVGSVNDIDQAVRTLLQLASIARKYTRW